MVKHIVLYTLKEGVDKQEAVKLIGSVLEPLVGKNRYTYSLSGDGLCPLF